MKIFFILLFLLSTNLNLLAQWSGEVYYLRGSDIPENGFGFGLERNLPIQFPSFGASVKFNAVYMFEKNTVDAHLFSATSSLIITANTGLLFPYFGFGLGYEYLGADFGLNKSHSYSGNFFILDTKAGVKILLSPVIQPFCEFVVLRRIPSESNNALNINTVQWRISLGLRVNTDLL